MEIVNREIYTARMRAGMEDKLWWVDKTNAEIVVDYGCADGSMLQILHEANPRLILIGVDNDGAMLSQARKNVPTALFFDTKSFFKLGLNLGNAILVLSSVIHEIYSYEEFPVNTMEKLFGMGFGQIAIRDMFLLGGYKKADLRHVDIVKTKADLLQMDAFERKWGSIRNQKNLIHFLLKYPYVENWEREVRENYLPLSVEDMIEMIPSQYQIGFLEHYLLPYFKQRVFNDFGIEIEDNTHLKLLLNKAKEK